MWKSFRKLADTNPVVGLSWVMGFTAISMPLVVVPIRGALGLKTNQYTKTQPQTRLIKLEE